MNKETFQTIQVAGITCSQCEAGIKRNLLKINGMDEVVADKYISRVNVRGSGIVLAGIERIVTDLGYHFKGCLI